MKAHIAKNGPLTLGYALSSEDVRAVESLGFAFRPISEELLNCEVGTLVDGGGIRSAFEGCVPEEKLLLLADFSRAEMDHLLDGLRAKSVSIPLKAVLTPTNRRWTVLELIEELRRERAAVQGRNPS